MNTSTPGAAAETQPADTDPIDWQTPMLREFAAMTMDMARIVHGTASHLQGGLANAAEPPTPREGASVASLALAFTRLGAVLRDTLALVEKLPDHRVRAAARRTSVELAQRAAAAEDLRARSLDRKHLVAVALDRAYIAQHGEADILTMRRRLTDRLPEIDDSLFADGPIVDVVEFLCRDLGITPDWPTWSLLSWYHPGPRSVPPEPNG